MQEWTDEFIRHAQQELVAMVKDWQYDYGPTDEECAASYRHCFGEAPSQTRQKANPWASTNP
jgi:hypothetical protein